MAELKDSHARLDGLEAAAAHQARALDDLNAAVTAQWGTLDLLQRTIRQLADRLEDMEARGAGSPPVQKPPHY